MLNTTLTLDRTFPGPGPNALMSVNEYYGIRFYEVISLGVTLRG